MTHAPATLKVNDLVVEYISPLGKVTTRAVDGVSLTVERGETVALVGESGSGKSSLVSGIMRLVRPTAGSVQLNGVDLTSLSDRQLRLRRRDVQMVFQDPSGSFNPRREIGWSIREPLRAIGYEQDIDQRVDELLGMVGLDRSHGNRFPSELSGGQRQRAAIGRALATEPHLIILDEAVAALDVSVQAQILKLLAELQQRTGVAYLFVTHDLALVRHIAHRTLVMYAGQIIEQGQTEQIFVDPTHPYTKALLSAVPRGIAGKRASRIILEGSVPDPASPPPGCRFHPRCAHRLDEPCSTRAPRADAVADGHLVTCHRWQELTDTRPAPPGTDTALTTPDTQRNQP